ncbi:RNA exonuclease 4 isoform X1 [Monodon monoceros]|uniref:RNA exonuclease 4 isoform X1 n=1 Tax=Monodon monoceros TaxID=40151 RepID=UPI0010F556A3|nr:RNA exonuclease 4 isoform X1 [Monodon monoceros]
MGRARTPGRETAARGPCESAPHPPLPGPAVQRPLAAACPALHRPGLGVTPTAAPPSSLPALTFLGPRPALGEIPGLPQPDPVSLTADAARRGGSPFPWGPKSPALLPAARYQRRRPGFQPVGERRALPGIGAHVWRLARGGFRGPARCCPRGRRIGVRRDLCSAGRARLRGRGATVDGRGGRDGAGMAKARVLAPERAPGDPAPEPELVKKPNRKKNRKKRFWKNKAREAGRKPGNGPGVVVVRPPKAPEDFSQNWKALQEELLKQKSQAPEEALVLSQTDSKKQPQGVQQNSKVISDKAKRDEMGTENTDPKATRGSLPSGCLTNRKIRAQRNEKGAKKRTNDDISPKREVRHKKWKAEEVTATLPPAPPTEEDIWFDDVDPADIEAAIGPEAARIARKRLGQSESTITLVKERAFSGLTKALAMDCEMVGVGPKGEESIVARVSLVNQYGKCVYDKYVKPAQPVTDYRTAVSGIRPDDLAQGEEFEVIQKEVADLLKGRILVGHALHNDLKALFLCHPKKKIRDTQKYKPFRSQVKAGPTEAPPERGCALPSPLAEWTAVSEAACGESPGDPGAAGGALLDSRCADSDEAVRPGEEGVGEHRPRQAAPGLQCPR